MTNPISYPNKRIPANYSGVTINITNPTVNTALQDGYYQPQPAGIYSMPQGGYYSPMQNEIYAVPQNTYYPQPQILAGQNTPAQNNLAQNEVQQSTVEKTNTVNNETFRETQYVQNPITNNNPEVNAINSYPPQYYLNNYNYVQGAEPSIENAPAVPAAKPQVQEVVENIPTAISKEAEQENLDTSNKIISEIDLRKAEQKELEKKSKKKKIVALTNEYIMSLENYLNNPNTELRIMASKEVLTRLDEDRDRYDDAALNALLNKMLQDPEKLVRIAALSAFSSELASGNDYTETLLKQIQQNPNADKEDVLEASAILLKRSAETEIKYVPVSENNKNQKQESKTNPNPKLMKGAK